MACDEHDHILVWRQLLAVAQSGDLPELFDDPQGILQELKEANKLVEAIGTVDPACTLLDAFRLALRMEFYLTNSVFAQLFTYAEGLGKDSGIAVRYSDHISQLLDTIGHTPGVTEEMQILGKALLRLWEQSRQSALLSYADPLTGVLNRRGFFNTVRPLAAMAQRSHTLVAMLMVDVDNFKQVNDTQGHDAGDRILRAIARVLGTSRRASDVVGRFGGEEFIVFLSSIDETSAERIAEKLREQVIEETQAILPVTISIGLAISHLYDDPEKSVLDLIILADSCMYEAKQAGKNQVVKKLIQNTV